MSPREFVYWLQGAFEVHKAFFGTDLVLMSDSPIREHLGLVLSQGTKVPDSEVWRFCLYMVGICDALAELTRDPSDDAVRVALTNKVRERLAAIFVHEIDPESGGSGSAVVLDAIHSGEVQVGLSGALKPTNLPGRPLPPGFKEDRPRC